MNSLNKGFCIYCGEEVDDRDYIYIGNTRVWSCGSSECERYIREEERAEVEEARMRAEDDNYGRYR